MKLIPLVAGLILAAASPVAAANLSDPVAGHPGLTQFDLAKLVITDLAPDAEGSVGGKSVVAFTHIEGKDSRIDLPDGVTISGIEIFPMPGDRSREIMLIDFGAQEGYVADANLMALFSLDPKPRLLDVTEVGSDRFVAVETPIRLLAPDAPLLMVESEHDNSNQSYLSTAMVTVRGDKFRWIDSVFTFNEHLCSYQNFQTTTYTPRPVKGSPYASIAVRVVDETKLTHDECGDETAPKASRRVIETVYRWDAAKHAFEPNNKALQRLMNENTKKF
ncbi:MAG TPA: hypothetical protein VGL66_03695 [Caulobacteraceae bacterium]|jgi:hypothetical protein